MEEEPTGSSLFALDRELHLGQAAFRLIPVLQEQMTVGTSDSIAMCLNPGSQRLVDLAQALRVSPVQQCGGSDRRQLTNGDVAAAALDNIAERGAFDRDGHLHQAALAFSAVGIQRQ